MKILDFLKQVLEFLLRTYKEIIVQCKRILGQGDADSDK